MPTTGVLGQVAAHRNRAHTRVKLTAMPRRGTIARTFEDAYRLQVRPDLTLSQEDLVRVVRHWCHEVEKPPNPDFVWVHGPLKVVQHNPVLILIGVDRPRQGE